MHKLSPSILSADFANLEQEIRAMGAAGADWIHVDVMDGHFVPNISIGLPVVASLRKKTDLPLDVHLMISDPLTYAPRFAEAGADLIVFHLESDCDPAEVIAAIRATGKRCGISIKPATPAEDLFALLPLVDLVLVMTVEPGFGGQRFMPAMCSKIRALRDQCDRLGLDLQIEVDGGIDPSTIGQVVRAGANVFVAGSALFAKADYTEAVRILMQAAREAAETCSPAPYIK